MLTKQTQRKLGQPQGNVKRTCPKKPKQEKSSRVENVVSKPPCNMKPSISIQRGHITINVNFRNYTLNNITINNWSIAKSLWCEPRDHVVTQPTIKIEIWSRKAKIDLIGVWHNGNHLESKMLSANLHAIWSLLLVSKEVILQ